MNALICSAHQLWVDVRPTEVLHQVDGAPCWSEHLNPGSGGVTTPARVRAWQAARERKVAAP